MTRYLLTGPIRAPKIMTALITIELYVRDVMNLNLGSYPKIGVHSSSKTVKATVQLSLNISAALRWAWNSA